MSPTITIKQPDPVAVPDKVTANRPIDPVTVTVIGTGDASRLPPTTEAETPGAHDPNVIIRAIQPFVAIAVRFVNVFLTQLAGLVVAGMTSAGGKLLYTSDFYHLILICASLSLPGAGIAFIKDLVTVFGRLEQKYPLLTGSV